MKQKRISSCLPLTHKRRFHFLMTYSSSCRISHWQMRSLYIQLNLSWASLTTSIWSTALRVLVYQGESPAERKICCQNRKLQNKWLCVTRRLSWRQIQSATLSPFDAYFPFIVPTGFIFLLASDVDLHGLGDKCAPEKADKCNQNSSDGSACNAFTSLPAERSGKLTCVTHDDN
jgi:hypothetical protein